MVPTSTANAPRSSDAVYQLPEGINVPSSINASLLQGDVVDLLRKLPDDRISAALETYDCQYKLRGDEIRNPRAYLCGILKGSGGRYGLPSGVSIPPSITQAMLEDSDLIDILKNMNARDINSCFRDFDEQIKKKSGSIRNKNAYLLGIIKSGPHYALPQGAVLPPTVSLAMLQGTLLETIQQLPSAHLNVAFGEYEEQMQKKGDSIRNRHGYLLGIVKRMKRTFEEEAAEHVAAQQQKQMAPPSPNNATRNKSSMTLKAVESQETLNMVTESFVKVTNELVLERQARNEVEGQMKIEQSRNEESNQRMLKVVSELAAEKEQQERSALEAQRLRKDVALERSLRETAEEKVQMLEESRENTLLQTQGSSPDSEADQLRKLELELSVERGLREKTEWLLRAAENRIDDLKRELQNLQQRTQTTQSPFDNWLGSQPTAINNEQESEDKKTAELPPSLSGISEFVSLSGFDPETFGFNKAEGSECP